MPQKIWEALCAKAKVRPLLFLLGLFLLWEILFGIANGPLLEKSGGVGMIDMKVMYSGQQAYDMVKSYGPDGRKAYAVISALDAFFPAIYAALFVLALVYFLGKSGLQFPLWRWAVLIPAIGAVFDYAENILVIAMLASFPSEGVKALGAVCSLAGLFKFILFAVSVLAIGALAAYPGIKKLIPAAKPVEKKEE